MKQVQEKIAKEKAEREAKAKKETKEKEDYAKSKEAKDLAAKKEKEQKLIDQADTVAQKKALDAKSAKNFQETKDKINEEHNKAEKAASANEKVEHRKSGDNKQLNQSKSKGIDGVVIPSKTPEE